MNGGLILCVCADESSIIDTQRDCQILMKFSISFAIVVAATDDGIFKKF